MSRRLTPEILDTLSTSDPSALASRADLQRLHPLLGQTRLWLRWIRNQYPDRPPSSLADLGSGDGHLLASLLPTLFPQGGHGARIFFIDRQPTVPDSALDSLRRKNWLPTVVAQDAVAWAASAPPTELIFTNLFLHHFPDSELKTLFLHLSTRTYTFVAAEPFRGFAGSLGARLLRLLGCHPVTQHDARVSVEAGFRPRELSKLWPQPHHWSLTEQRVGLFTHFFTAEKKSMRQVTILGGGLAGLTLGLRLRQKGVPVKLFDAGSYPRHRVCGEYLSGHALSVIDSLGLRPGLRALGAVESSDVILARGNTLLARKTLPQPALCLSRYQFDQFLVKELTQVGGEIFTGKRISPQPQEGVVLATGRQPSTTEQGWRWFGLKAHAHNVDLGAGLEMHLSPRGYVGLCRIEQNQVNVCGLFRSRTAIPDLSSTWKEWLSGDPHSLLSQRLKDAVWDESSFSSIAALSLTPKKASALSGVRIGDALTMIPPVTGNGMSMAIEGADTAAGPLADWSSHRQDWNLTSKLLAAQLDQTFAKRLLHARWLQHAMLDPLTQSITWNLARIFPSFPSLLFRLTR